VVGYKGAKVDTESLDSKPAMVIFKCALPYKGVKGQMSAPEKAMPAEKEETM
jgi:hypothetical protein